MTLGFERYFKWLIRRRGWRTSWKRRFSIFPRQMIGAHFWRSAGKEEAAVPPTGSNCVTSKTTHQTAFISTYGAPAQVEFRIRTQGDGHALPPGVLYVYHPDASWTYKVTSFYVGPPADRLIFGCAPGMVARQPLRCGDPFTTSS